MDSHEVLSQATIVAREALAKAKRADLEETVRDFESSPIPVMRSLARVYRISQYPPFK
jgi:hypothetical protein